VVTGLSAASTYRFGSVVSDSDANASPVSNSPSCTTTAADVVAPSAPTITLTGCANTSCTFNVNLGSVGNNGATGSFNGGGEIRCRQSASAINTGNFGSATNITGTEPLPVTGDTTNSVTATGLSVGTPYHFACVVLDDAATPNQSAASNDITGTTTGGADTTDPGTITTLAVTGCSSTACDLTWMNTCDDGASGAFTTGAYVDLRVRLVLDGGIVDQSGYDDATLVTVSTAPVCNGSQGFQVTGLNPDTEYDFGITLVDEASNAGAVNTPLPVRRRTAVTSALTIGCRGCESR